jgi:hypothetical protein
LSIASSLEESGAENLLNDEQNSWHDEINPKHLSMDYQEDPEWDIQHVGPVKHLNKGGMPKR